MSMSGVGEKASGSTKTPADFLKSIRGRPVVVKLNSGVDYRGGSLSLSRYLVVKLNSGVDYRVFGALKGALNIPHSDKRFAGFSKENKQLDSATHAKYIYVGHEADYMNTLNEDEPEKFQTHFSEYVKKGIEADEMEALYAAIRAYPLAKKAEKQSLKEHKRFNLKRRTY